ncbi:hypothetical protein F2Q69_00031038 [Brassica cretica]|uniref:Uncharacterized protein n=1 Tax=Brassica cretica TaxID=69181 RepID=A0A8S9S1D5_BRACR|nr:hypothetical protein F2Q69_00031038 [Brassica cretica]
MAASSTLLANLRAGRCSNIAEATGGSVDHMIRKPVMLLSRVALEMLQDAFRKPVRLKTMQPLKGTHTSTLASGSSIV